MRLAGFRPGGGFQPGAKTILGTYSPNVHPCFELFGFGMAALLIVEQRRIVEAGGGVGVFGSERFFVYGEGTAVQFLGLVVAALVTVEQARLYLAFLLNVRSTLHTSKEPGEAITDYVLAHRIRRSVLALCQALLDSVPAPKGRIDIGLTPQCRKLMLDWAKT